MKDYKIGYTFDKSTGKFISIEKIYLEKRTGLYPHADNVVFKEPPETEEHEGAYWDGKKWTVKVDEGYIKKNGSIREMTRVEKIEAGLEELTDYEKIEDGKIVPKTRDDLFNEGKLTVEEYNKQVDQERQNRYMMETDKMALMYLRGEYTLEEWKAAMDKIREELPKKEK